MDNENIKTNTKVEQNYVLENSKVKVLRILKDLWKLVRTNSFTNIKRKYGNL